MGTNNVRRLLAQAVLEEAHTLKSIEQSRTSGHQKAVCEDREGREFTVVCAGTPRGAKTLKIYRSYVSKAYRHFIATAKKFEPSADLEVNTRVEVKAGKTLAQLTFESQNGKYQKRLKGVA